MPVIPYLPNMGINYPAPGHRGVWDDNTNLNTLATNLPAPPAGVFGPAMLTAIPNVWARMLLFSEALFDPAHPIHDSVEEEWRGLLGVIGLGAIYGLRVDGNIVNIGAIYNLSHAGLALTPVQKNSLRFDTILLKQLPQPVALYINLELIICDGELIGAYSPMCLVFTGARYNCPATIPWRIVTAGTGKLTDPVPYLRDAKLPDVRNSLRNWVTTLHNNIRDHVPIGINLDDTYRDRLVTALNNWLAVM